MRKPLLKEAILRNLRRQIPAQHVVLLDHDGAVVAVYGDGLREPGVHTGGCLDDSQRAIGEAETGDGGVLDFDPLMRERGGEAADVRDWTHHP